MANSEKYLELCRENILPLSGADTLPGAFEEWDYTGEVEDFGEPAGTCELCGYNPLRWHFEIQSTRTDESLYIGSKCIEHFAGTAELIRGRSQGISDQETLQEMEDEARKKARANCREVKRRYKKDQFVEKLRRLYTRENSPEFRKIIHSIAEDIKETRRVSPKQAKVLAWRAEKNGVELPFEYLKIDLRKKRHKKQVQDIEDWQLRQFWEAFSNDQQNRIQKRGWANT